MLLGSLLFGSRKTPPPTPDPASIDRIETPMYVAGLVANLLNRAAATRGFRGAIPAHPHMNSTSATFGSDEGSRADMNLTAMATANRASITVSGMDAGRLAFLTFGPVHKQTNGCEPDWQFDDPGAAMTARCRIIGLTLDVSCMDNPDGSATLHLQLVS